MSNSKKIKGILAVTAGIWAVSMLGLHILWAKSEGLPLWAVLLFGLWNFLLFAGSHWCISRVVNQVLWDVSETLDSLMRQEPVLAFSEAEDTVLGKFQHQARRLYTILNAGKEEEKERRRRMSEMVSDLVHQINTPLTNIQMYSGFLAEEEMGQKDRKEINRIIGSQVEKLSWFGEGFAKVARLEDDMMQLVPKRQPVFPAVLGAIDQISPKAKKEGREIRLLGQESLQAVFDARWTEEAIFNLLDNGVKYGEKNSEILVEVKDYDLFVRIDVSTWGSPILREDYNKLFQRFYRGENASCVKEGVGLGLYLVRNIINSQGGYVKVSPYKGRGNTFSLFLRKAI